MEEYYDILKLQCITTGQAGLCESNMAITMEDKIAKSL